MYLRQRFNYFTPAQFSGTGSGAGNILGTTQKWNIDRTWPIEEIITHVKFTVTTALYTSSSPQSPDQLDGIMQLVQHINLSTNDGKQPRSVIDCTGVGSLEYAQTVGLNLPMSTQVLAAWTYLGGTPAGTNSGILGLPPGSYVLTYRLPMVHPWIGDPLRSRFYLPVHLYPQDPVLTLTFQSLANMCSLGAIGSIFTDVMLIRREPTAASEEALQATAGTNPSGYYDWDLLETPFGVAPGISSEQRFPLPVPGAYTEIMMRQYLGGANITRQPLDYTGVGISTGTGFGAEQRWRLETGGVVLREWRWNHLREVNDFSKPSTSGVITGTLTLSSGTVSTYNLVESPGIIGTPTPFYGTNTITNFRPPTSCHINFLSDGLTGDTGIELGSVLDCNTPANTGLKMEIIGTPANVATNASTLAVMGRRLYGDLSRWQKFA
jgi:hypothetical protein